MTTSPLHKPKPAIAVALSVVLPGLGQVYSGDRRRGFAILISVEMLVWLKLALHALTSNAQPTGSIFVSAVSIAGSIATIAIVVTYLWSIWDAGRSARTSDAPMGRAWDYVLAVMLLCVPQGIIVGVHLAWASLARAYPSQIRVVTQIGSALVHPDVATQKSLERTAIGRYTIGPSASQPTAQPRDAGKPRLTVSPSTAAKGDKLALVGTGFPAGARGTLTLLGTDERPVGEFSVDSQGRFVAYFVNPRDISGDYFIEARVRVLTGGWRISDTLAESARLMVQTVLLALIGTAISLVFALPLSFLGARNLMSGAPALRVLYGITRGVFTILRSVEVLIIAVMAVAVFGIGSAAGVIAIAIHGIGALGKLYSESIESIEHGPIEAIRATGANELQVVVYGVVPQVVPQYIAFTLYRWDINVRMATVIGLVGGGGIGSQLIQYMNLLQWPQAATALWLIAGVVMVMDYASAVIREKVI